MNTNTIHSSDNSFAVQATPNWGNKIQHSPSSSTILVIEDMHSIRVMLKNILEMYGYIVLTAENGLVGLNTFKKNISNIDFIISDVDMPIMNGIQAYEQMCILKPSQKAMFMSGNMNIVAGDLKPFKGVVKALHKPFDLRDIINTVQTHV